MSRRREAARTVALGAVLALTSASPALGAIECGDTITRDKTLRADLDCRELSDFTALTVGADGVELDLNGHTIWGPNSGGGVRINPGADNARVVDGRIVDFATQVSIFSGQKAVVRNLRLRGAVDQGVRIFEAIDATVEDNTISDVPVGVTHFDGNSNVIAGNEFAEVGEAVKLHEALTPVVRDSIVDVTEGPAIVVQNVTDGKVVGNVVRQGGATGIDVNADASGLAVKQNSLHETTFAGVNIRTGATDINVVANRVLDGLLHGIEVGNVTAGSLRANIAKRNDSDGIRVTDTEILIEDNVSNDNSGHGIDSASANGSGNRARNNGGVDCSPLSLCEPGP